MNILLATTNAGKVTEIREGLQGLPITLLTPDHLDIRVAPEETGSTFEENALQKAHFYHAHAKLPTIADDSGIIIEALQDELGIHTRRWGAGPHASDEEWIEYFLDRMKKEKNKRAHFVCTLAFIDAAGAPHIFEGRSSGVITDALEAEYLPGLPLSACFRPDDHTAVFSALSIEQKIIQVIGGGHSHPCESTSFHNFKNKNMTPTFSSSAAPSHQPSRDGA